jgi:uncharacterized Rmd1/YagE family protein
VVAVSLEGFWECDASQSRAKRSVNEERHFFTLGGVVFWSFSVVAESRFIAGKKYQLHHVMIW